MKLSNIFKKTTKTVAKVNVEKLEKQQLEKVIGGVDETPIIINEEAVSGRSPKIKNSW